MDKVDSLASGLIDTDLAKQVPVGALWLTYERFKAGALLS